MEMTLNSLMFQLFYEFKLKKLIVWHSKLDLMLEVLDHNILITELIAGFTGVRYLSDTHTCGLIQFHNIFKGFMG